LEIAIERADRGHRTLNPARSQAFRAPRGQERTHIGWPQLLQRGKRDLAAVVARKKPEEPRRVVAIGAQRMRAHAPLIGEARKPRLGQLAPRTRHLEDRLPALLPVFEE